DAVDYMGSFYNWLSDRRNRRTIPHRFEQVGYIPHRNPYAKDGLWVVGGVRCAIYVDKSLSQEKRHKAVDALVNPAEEEREKAEAAAKAAKAESEKRKAEVEKAKADAAKAAAKAARAKAAKASAPLFCIRRICSHG